MNDRSGELDKTRINVTLTRPYVEALNHLVEEGIYLSRGEGVLEGLRIIFRLYKLEPFWVPEGPPEEGGEGVVGACGSEEDHGVLQER